MTDVWSIADGYLDVDDQWHDTPEDTRALLRSAMGGDDLDAPPAPPPLWFVPFGEGPRLNDPCDLLLEDGTVVEGLTALPPDLPLGYHRIVPVDGGPATEVVCTPVRCPLPDPQWGWAVQLYATRSHRSWGIGDLGDLRDLARWSRGLGAGVLMINPLHATPPTLPQEPSPYFATSRLWRNLLYLRVEDLPGAEMVASDLEPLAGTGRSLDGLPTIDRNRIFKLKLAALERVFDSLERSPRGLAGLDAWAARQGASLERFATWSAIAEEHGPNRFEWPAELAHPEAPGVAAFRRTHVTRIRFHAWIQWQLERQYAEAAGQGVRIMNDLAVGFDPAGADGWAYQDLLAPGVRVGAPPDAFSETGQDWGLPPFVPWKVRAAGYRPFIDTFRSALAFGGGMRIDHVMGLFRLYWIPPGKDATGGAFVRYEAKDLLDLLALEAHRAKAFVVGEDLGTVEEEVRAALLGRGILSYRLFFFQPEPVPPFPRLAMATVTTHDLPTIAGIWSGADREMRDALGLLLSEDDPDEDLREKLEVATGLEAGAPVDEVIVAAHRALGDIPALVRLATLEDAVGEEERPNLPGTVDERQNWRIPLAVPLEDLPEHPLVQRVVSVMQETASGGPDGGDA